MRVCTRCGERKAIESFRYQPTRGTHHSWCRECERVSQRESAARRTNRQARRAAGQRSTRNNGGRVFGVEMELTGPSRRAIAGALDAAGISYRITGYQATNGAVWELKTDGSVNGHGLELVSPKLRGEAGFAELQRVCEALRSVNATVDSSCGVHVHVDFRNRTVEQIRDAILPLAEAQDALYEMSAPSRRNNHYVPRWSDRDLRTLRGMVHLRDLGRLPRGVVNAQSYTRHGSIEFRSHGGSTSFVRISAWVRMLIAAVEHGERTNGGSLGDGTAASLLRTIGTSQEDANVLLRFTQAAQMLECRVRRH